MIAPARHHVTLETVGSDFERIEVIGADALFAARNAWNLIGNLPGEIAVELKREIVDLRWIVEADAMLAETSRNLLRDLIRLLEDRRERTDPALHHPLIDCLHDAVRQSQRVADLIAAERHVGRARDL